MKHNWAKTTVGESCEFYNGKAHEKQIDNDGDFIVVNSRFISSDGAVIKKTSKALFPLYRNDVVMVMSDVPNGKALAKCYLIEEDNKYSLNQRICAIRSDEFNTRFLYYHLNRNPHLLSFDNGENQTNLRKKDILECPLYFPPIAQQKQIVAILDEAFEGIDSAIANTEKNLANARELFESYLNAIFTRKGDDWEDKKIKDVTEKVEYGTSAKSSPDGEVPVLRMGNIQNGALDWRDLVYTDSQEDIDKYLLKYNDVLFNRTNSAEHVGKTAIYKGEMPAIFAGYLIRIHRKEDLIDADFLNFYLNSYRAREYGKSVMSQSVNQANINGTKLKDYPIPVPPLAEQKQIVKKLSRLLAETQRLEAIYQQKLAALNELKQSILQRAFAGELTAEVDGAAVEKVGAIAAA